MRSEVGDEVSAELLEGILVDEIAHAVFAGQPLVQMDETGTNRRCCSNWPGV
jgi:bacterioferritin (cytochrome b1)